MYGNIGTSRNWTMLDLRACEVIGREDGGEVFHHVGWSKAEIYLQSGPLLD